MKPELGTLSLDVSKRILDKLSDGELNRTNLASSARINYNTLVHYLNTLVALGWVAMTDQGTIMITPLGREVRKRLLSLASNEPGAQESDVTSLKDFASSHAIVVGKSGKLSDQVSRTEGGKRKKRYLDTGAADKSRMRSVIIVDDEPEVALTYKMFLESTDRYHVETFTEPSLALKEFANNPDRYDMAILDIRMPRINGLKLYQRMSAMSANCRFLFISALDAAGELLSVLPAVEPQDLIRKPIAKGGFIRAVDSHFMVN